jgi:hypothetical protein
MRTALAVVLALVLSAPAVAGMNPECQVCIDFSGTAISWTDVQGRIDPQLYETFSAYFCAYGINGFTGICMRGYVTPGMSATTQFTSLLPLGVAFGGWDEGVALASPDCHTDRFLYFARLDLLYLGNPGDVMILDHPEYPRWVMDCTQPSAELDYYCVWMHGGVGKDPLVGDQGCFPVVPVEDTTWGSVKALYR